MATGDKTEKCFMQLQDFKESQEGPAQLTTATGFPVPKYSLTSSMTVGRQGPIVLQDLVLIDHLSHFDRERIPERVVHAKGAGAFGYFEVTNSEITKYCKAKLFSHVGKRTPIAARFSTVGGEQGSADTVRDPRGFAVKFYTEEGNWDMVGNNTPIFFVRDPILFPSFIHTQKRNPRTHLKDADMFWDFLSLRPESLHQVSFLMSDRGTPDGYRHMNGYGSHTFKFVNDKGEPFWVKYHFKTDQGIKNLMIEEAEKLAGENPDYATQDLYNAIAEGDYPSWTMYIQVMTFEEAEKVDFNPFDLTKVWPHGDFPLREVGRMVLNRNPENYFAEVEQMAFSPAAMVPGIEPSPDKMLQGRLFSYDDTHRHRLGPNFLQLPVNQAKCCKVNHYQRDGPMCFSDNMGGAPNYFPNSFSGPTELPNEGPHFDTASGQIRNFDMGDDDNYSQVGKFYRQVLNDDEKHRLIENIAGHLGCAKDFIQKRQIEHFKKADEEYGRRVEEAIAQRKKAAAQKKEQKKAEAAPLNPPRQIPAKM